MAVARPQGGGMNGMKAAMIASIVVAVLSVAGTVILYTYQSDLENRSQAASESAQRAQAQAGEARQEMSDFARVALGEANMPEGPLGPALRQQFNTALERVFADPRLKGSNLTRDSALLTVLNTLYGAFDQTQNTLAKLAAEKGDLQQQCTAMAASAKQAQEAFEAHAKAMQERYDTLEKQAAQARAGWDRQVAELTKRLTDDAARFSQDLNKAREEGKQLTKDLENCRAQAEAILARAKPNTDQRGALQTGDGMIVRTVAGENIVYISLGKQEGIKPGMTFSVYARSRGIPDDGAGKATVEVVNVFATTAECRVTGRTPGDPIVEGDLIANSAFDRSRQFSFAILGDFDLDYDGRIEDPGGMQVARLIQAAGGKVVDRVDPQTDFVVVGMAPPLAGVPSDDAKSADHNRPDSIDQEKESDQVVAERMREREQARKHFDATLQEAKSLGIPILTRTQFLHFMGKVVPAGATDGTPAS